MSQAEGVPPRRTLDASGAAGSDGRDVFASHSQVLKGQTSEGYRPVFRGVGVDETGSLGLPVDLRGVTGPISAARLIAAPEGSQR